MPVAADDTSLVSLQNFQGLILVVCGGLLPHCYIEKQEWINLPPVCSAVTFCILAHALAETSNVKSCHMLRI